MPNTIPKLFKRTILALAGLVLFVTCKKEEGEGVSHVKECPDQADFKILWRQDRDTNFVVNKHHPFIQGSYLIYRTWRGYGDKFVIRNIEDGSLFDDYFITIPGLVTGQSMSGDGLIYFNHYSRFGIFDPVAKSTQFIYYPETVASSFLMNGDILYLLGWSKDSTRSTEFLLSFNISTERLDTIHAFEFNKAPNRGNLLELEYFYEKNGADVVVLRQGSPKGYYSNFVTYIALNTATGNIMSKVETNEIAPSQTIGKDELFTFYEWSESFHTYNMSTGSKGWTFTPPEYKSAGIRYRTEDLLVIEYYPGVAVLPMRQGGIRWIYDNFKPVSKITSYESDLLLASENTFVQLNEEDGCLIEKLEIHTKGSDPGDIRHMRYFPEEDMLVVITEKEVLALRKS